MIRNGVYLRHAQKPRLNIYVAESDRLNGDIRHVVRIRLRHAFYNGRRVIRDPAVGSVLRGICYHIAVGIVPLNAVREQIVFFAEQVFPALTRVKRPQICLRRFVVGLIPHRSRNGLLPERFETEGIVYRRCVPLFMRDGYFIAAVFNKCYCFVVAAKRFFHGHARAFGDKHAVNMPAVGVFVFENVPADGKVFRGQFVTRVRLSVNGYRFASRAKRRENVFVGRERLKSYSLNRRVYDFSELSVNLIGGVGRGGRCDYLKVCTAAARNLVRSVNACCVYGF